MSCISHRGCGGGTLVPSILMAGNWVFAEASVAPPLFPAANHSVTSAPLHALNGKAREIQNPDLRQAVIDAGAPAEQA
ncbi:hypothetical protein HDK77DRAFT_487451 [Phyllosticta capitalensis]|uniref:Uncharacterized protein n=1 Tax=Phyllosticta capitalensis TaxID=121624 RepID=A0ABR1Z1F4_9PEZI